MKLAKEFISLAMNFAIVCYREPIYTSRWREMMLSEVLLLGNSAMRRAGLVSPMLKSEVRRAYCKSPPISKTMLDSTEHTKMTWAG